jgi:uncharacterized protein (TIGR02996 family)
MQTEDEFLAAIGANLDDDAPRLAHADWLQERDPLRAEYVRLEVRLARAGWRSWHGEDERRAALLLHANRERWLAGRPQARGIEWKFERGYPESVAFSTRGAFDANWRKALTPPLRWVAFQGMREPRWFIDSPALARVRWLSVSHCGVNDEVLPVLLDSPHLQGLQGLALSGGGLGGESLRLIASSPKLAGLRELDLGGTWRRSVAPEHLAALASPNLTGLRKLDLSWWQMGDKAAQSLWAARWPDLVSLRLSQNDLTAEGLVGLGDGGGFPALVSLDLSNNHLGDDGAVALARVSAWSRLRWLNLNGNLIGERGVRALAGAAHLAGLECLDLTSNAIPDGGAEAIASMRALVALRLAYNLIGDAGATALGRSRSLSRLRVCTLHDNPARSDLISAVEKRFELGGPPLADVAAVPAAPVAPAEGGSVVGPIDEDGLVRALYAAPYDDLAHGAYADWLEENGSPQHARLLRMAPNDPERGKLIQAISESVQPTFSDFEDPVGEESGLLFVCLGVRTFLSKDFGRNGPAWLRQNHVSNVFLVGDSKDWSRIGNSPAAAHLRGLWLRNQRLCDRGLVQLASATGLANLGSLDLHNAQVGDEGVRALASTTNFPRLSHLSLFWARPSVEALRALASGPLVASLRCLDLGQMRLSDVGMAVLAQSPGLSGLVTLKLEYFNLSDRGMLSLIDSPHLTNLRGLDLSGNYPLTDVGVRALARSPLASRLRWLRLRNVSMSPESRETLARALPPGGRLVLE